MSEEPSKTTSLLAERDNIVANLTESYARVKQQVSDHNDYVRRAYKRLEWIDKKLKATVQDGNV